MLARIDVMDKSLAFDIPHKPPCRSMELTSAIWEAIHNSEIRRIRIPYGTFQTYDGTFI